ncbi:Rrf2 family transcriptional regulator [Bacteroides acidifaciens]
MRMMIDIAMNQQEGPVSVRDIARRQSLSDKYLEQMITLL